VSFGRMVVIDLLSAIHVIVSNFLMNAGCFIRIG